MRSLAHTLLRCAARRASTLAIAAGVALWLECAPARAVDAFTEPQIKAAYIYNFARFVQWPADAFATPQTPLVLCTSAKEALGGALAGIEGKPVQGRDLRVRRGVKIDELKTCHILFVPQDDERAAAELLRSAAAMPVLVVGDHDGFAASGGVIGFVTRDEHVQFEINPEAASRANLKISSHLLQLATVVRESRRRSP